MSLFEKMNLWSSKAEAPNILVSDAYFEGVKDDEGECINLAKISDHCNVISTSRALSWLISSLQTRSRLQWEADQTEELPINAIRRAILGALPSEKISKRRRPRDHHIAFRFPWQHFMGRAGVGRGAAIAITACSGKAQMTSIKQYMNQTWPDSWGHISELIRYANHLTLGSHRTQDCKQHESIYCSQKWFTRLS